MALLEIGANYPKLEKLFRELKELDFQIVQKEGIEKDIS